MHLIKKGVTYMSNTKKTNGSQICYSQVVRYEKVLDILMSSDRAMTVKEIKRKLELNDDDEVSEKQVRKILDYLSEDYDLREYYTSPDGTRSKSIYYRIVRGKKDYLRKKLHIFLPENASEEKLEMLCRFADILCRMDDLEEVRERMAEFGL